MLIGQNDFYKHIRELSEITSAAAIADQSHQAGHSLAEEWTKLLLPHTCSELAGALGNDKVAVALLVLLPHSFIFAFASWIYRFPFSLKVVAILSLGILDGF